MSEITLQPEIDRRQSLKEQVRLLKSYLRAIFSPRETGTLVKGLEPEEGVSPQDRQIYLRDRILNNLATKGILASPEERFKVYNKDFGISSYSAPEAFLQYGGGKTDIDPQTGKIKIYLNPHFASFKPDYQLLTLLEEAMHRVQLRKSEGRRITWQDELEASKKLLRMADYLGLSQERVGYLKEVTKARQAMAKKEEDNFIK